MSRMKRLYGVRSSRLGLGALVIFAILLGIGVAASLLHKEEVREREQRARQEQELQESARRERVERWKQERLAQEKVAAAKAEADIARSAAAIAAEEVIRAKLETKRVKAETDSQVAQIRAGSSTEESSARGQARHGSDPESGFEDLSLASR